jgi:hypothetical protein
MSIVRPSPEESPTSPLENSEEPRKRFKFANTYRLKFACHWQEDRAGFKNESGMGLPRSKTSRNEQRAVRRAASWSAAAPWGFGFRRTTVLRGSCMEAFLPV